MQCISGKMSKLSKNNLIINIVISGLVCNKRIVGFSKGHTMPKKQIIFELICCYPRTCRLLYIFYFYSSRGTYHRMSMRSGWKEQSPVTTTLATVQVLKVAGERMDSWILWTSSELSICHKPTSTRTPTQHITWVTGVAIFAFCLLLYFNPN